MRVLIIDDHRLFADAVRSSLEARGQVVVGIAETGSAGLEMASSHKPDLALVDLGLPDESGVVVGAKIIQMSPETRVLAVTASTDPRSVTEVLTRGFHGYLTKSTPLAQFVSAIDAVANGQTVLPERLRQPGRAHGSEDWYARLLAEQLSRREMEVLQLLGAGATSRSIAETLSVTRNTVRSHVQCILTKLQVHSRLEAVSFALRHGLIKVDAA
jgi:two-component system nitrate/nitrite response regulator NarL